MNIISLILINLLVYLRNQPVKIERKKKINCIVMEVFSSRTLGTQTEFFIIILACVCVCEWVCLCVCVCIELRTKKFSNPKSRHSVLKLFYLKYHHSFFLSLFFALYTLLSIDKLAFGHKCNAFVVVISQKKY